MKVLIMMGKEGTGTLGDPCRLRGELLLKRQEIGPPGDPGSWLRGLSKTCMRLLLAESWAESALGPGSRGRASQSGLGLPSSPGMLAHWSLLKWQGQRRVTVSKL